jgi:hypothetical protein
MNENKVLVTLSVILVYVFGMITGNMIGEKSTEIHAVKIGVAQYNAKTGAFEWISREEPEPVHDYALDVQMQIERARQENWKCE